MKGTTMQSLAGQTQKQKQMNNSNDVMRSFKATTNLATGLTKERAHIQHDLLKISHGKDQLEELKKMKKVKQPILTAEEKASKINKAQIKGTGFINNMVCSEKGKQMIENQRDSRRQRHIEALKEAEKFVEQFYDNFKEKKVEIGERIKAFLSSSDVEIQNIMKGITDDLLLSNDIAYVNSIWEKVSYHRQERKDQVKHLYDSFQDLKTFQEKGSGGYLDSMRRNLIDIAFILEPEVDQLIEKWVQDENLKYIREHQENDEFYQQIVDAEQEKFNLLYQQWKDSLIILKNKLAKRMEQEIEYDEYLYMPKYNYIKKQKSEQVFNQKYIDVIQYQQDNYNSFSYSKFDQNQSEIEIFDNQKIYKQQQKENKMDQFFNNLAISHKQEKIKYLDKQKQKFELRNCTFRPDIKRSQKKLKLYQQNKLQRNISMNEINIKSFQTQCDDLEASQRSIIINFKKKPCIKKKQNLSKSQSQNRFELLYQSHQNLKERLEIKKQEIDNERMKPCTFKPERKTKQFEQKIGLLQNIDQYERVYKLQIDDLVKKYINQQGTTQKIAQQNVVFNQEQSRKLMEKKIFKDQINKQKQEQKEQNQQKFSKLFQELTQQFNVKSPMNTQQVQQKQINYINKENEQKEAINYKIQNQKKRFFNSLQNSDTKQRVENLIKERKSKMSKLKHMYTSYIIENK